MRRRKRPPPPPTPEGKVLRRGLSGELEEQDIKMIQEYAKFCLKTEENPGWRQDPSYWWAQKAKK